MHNQFRFVLQQQQNKNMRPQKVRKAGAVITRDNNGITELLLLFRAKQDNWSLPKGHIEAGETAEQAMVREVKEETGLDVAVRSPLPPLEYVTPGGY